jgi:hypothetical protein
MLRYGAGAGVSGRGELRQDITTTISTSTSPSTSTSASTSSTSIGIGIGASTSTSTGTFFKMLVDGWCLQNRVGVDTVCKLCRKGKESLLHLQSCPIVWKMMEAILRVPSGPRLSKSYNFTGTQTERLKHMVSLHSLRSTLDGLRTSSSPLPPLALALVRRKSLAREHPATRKLLVLD